MAPATIPAPLAGKVAIVTGGSRGIGRGIAVHFATKGIAKIAITYAANASAADETLAQVRKVNPNIKATAFKADVLSPTFAQDVVTQALADLSTQTIDIIVSNAPYVNTEEALPIASMTKKVFDNLLAGNAWAPVQLFLAALPHIPRGGRVIMISSTASRAPSPDPVVCYAVSKAALDSFTRSLALIFSAKHGITINSVSVGATMTDLVRIPMEAGVLPRELIDMLVSKNTAEKRLAEVEDIAGIVGFLASEESRWINGEFTRCSVGFFQHVVVPDTGPGIC
jgi:3-oxoacyl-[acyl-carrier protein] reductase